MIAAPPQKIECDKDEENPSGLKTGVRTLYSSVMRGTHANLTEPWVALLTRLTTRSDSWQTVDEPIDASKRLLYSGLSFDVQDDDGDQVSHAGMSPRACPHRHIHTAHPHAISTCNFHVSHLVPTLVCTLYLNCNGSNSTHHSLLLALSNIPTLNASR